MNGDIRGEHMPLRNLSGVRLCTFHKGEYLIKQGESINFLYYLVAGEVHRKLLTEKGDEIVLTIKTSHQDDYVRSLIGVLVLYDKYEKCSISNCDFVAHTDCTCYKIPVSSYKQFEKDHENEILKQLLSYVMDNYEIIFGIYYSKNHKSTASLLCRTILEYSIKENNQLIFGRNITKTELSKRLDIHPVTVSKIFQVLLKENILSQINNREYVINDLQYLQDICSNKIELSYKYTKKET